MKNLPELSVVIPTYNEKKSLEILIPSLEETFREHRISAEIIIVDDNSPDETGEVSRKLNRKYKNIVSVIRTKERGIASAWFHGYSIAKGKYIATMDADLCHRPEDLMKMYQELPKFDIVIGSRYTRKGSGMSGKGIIQIMASKVAQFVIKLFIGIKKTDMTHSFRVYKREVFHSIKKELNTSGNVFLVMFLYLAIKKGYTVTEVPIQYGKRKYGKTKLNIYNEGMRFMFKAFELSIKSLFSKKKK